jgi:hypothetical protein
VLPGSPAATAGIELHDLLLVYDTKPITSHQQLQTRVLEDRPGRRIQLRLVRAGKLLELGVELGQRTSRAAAGKTIARPLSITPMNRFMMTAGRETVHALELAVLDDELKLELVYRDGAGSLQYREAKGTRAAIAEALRDLPVGVQDEVRRRLDDAVAFAEKRALYSLRLKPLLANGKGDGVEVSLSLLGTDGVVRTRLFEAPADVDAILQRLHDLPEVVRQQMAKSLRNRELRTVLVPADRSI